MRRAWHALRLHRDHDFNSLSVLSCPELVLATIAAQTKQVRLARAVTVPPLHHHVRVAEQSATLDLLSGGRVDFAVGRDYDSREYLPFDLSFAKNQSIFQRRHGRGAQAVVR